MRKNNKTNSRKASVLRRGFVQKYDLQKNEIVIKHFNKKGQLSKKRGPALVVVDAKSKKVRKQAYYHNGKLHKKDGPAYLEFHPQTGKLVVEKYYVSGKLHREDGPAVIEKYPDGTLKTEKRCVNGKLHHPELPALIEYYPNGKPKLVCWYKDGKLHRHPRKGPAYLAYDENGNVVEKKFFFEDREVSPDVCITEFSSAIQK